MCDSIKIARHYGALAQRALGRPVVLHQMVHRFGQPARAGTESGPLGAEAARRIELSSN